jgi:hypothetical protein
MLRGTNRQAIFEDDEDAGRSLGILAECRALGAWRLFGYCLMGNHAHILIGCEGRPLGGVLKRIGVRCAPWPNKGCGRIGRLFQGRYRSEPPAGGGRLLAALRHVRQNPPKARLCRRAGDHRLSSYGRHAGRPGIADVGPVLGMLCEGKGRQRQGLEALMLAGGDAGLIGDGPARVTGRERREAIGDTAGTASAARFQALSPYSARRGPAADEGKGAVDPADREADRGAVWDGQGQVTQRNRPSVFLKGTVPLCSSVFSVFRSVFPLDTLIPLTRSITNCRYRTILWKSFR